MVLVHWYESKSWNKLVFEKNWKTKRNFEMEFLCNTHSFSKLQKNQLSVNEMYLTMSILCKSH